MKIYAVTKNKYPYSYICALTVDRSKAERICRIYTNDLGEAKVEEFEDGNIFWFFDKDGCSPEEFQGDEEVIVDNIAGEILGAFVYAQDESHAEKKALDMIFKYKSSMASI